MEHCVSTKTDSRSQLVGVIVSNQYQIPLWRSTWYLSQTLSNSSTALDVFNFVYSNYFKQLDLPELAHRVSTKTASLSQLLVYLSRDVSNAIMAFNVPPGEVF